ncbi:Pycsar system effector family protein [Streptomyces sp. NPDC052127]|uniref:Pycsar system effector family protein n=1 Tax=Streptomyces sp. NPDC052127 TaxID=3155679 RepID=UPI003417927F
MAVTTTRPDATTPTATSDQIDRRLDIAVETLIGTLGRCDNKASVLLALTGAGLAIVVPAAAEADPPASVLTVGGLGVAAWVAAIVCLLLTVRPHLSNDDGASWPHWSKLTRDEIHGRMGEDRRTGRIKVLSDMARTKFTYVRWAVDLMLAGMTFLTAAAVVAVIP